MNRTALAVILIIVIVAAIAVVVYMATKSGQPKGGSYEAPPGQGASGTQPQAGQMQQQPQEIQ
ncbi:MAG: hypothetical protein ACUVX8_11145 [Candidatus Zipacnadales bacterium]